MAAVYRHEIFLSRLPQPVRKGRKADLLTKQTTSGCRAEFAESMSRYLAD